MSAATGSRGMLLVRAREVVREGFGCGASLEETLEHVKMFWLRATLAENGQNQCAAAESLGIHRDTLHRLMKRIGVRAERPKQRQRKAAA
jgi:DNA-binding NtrC family response regulator